jgi:hypothetical protein
MNRIVQMKRNPDTEKPFGMRKLIPSGEAALGSDGLFEAVIGYHVYHEAGPCDLPGKCNDKKHVIAINERIKTIHPE